MTRGRLQLDLYIPDYALQKGSSNTQNREYFQPIYFMLLALTDLNIEVSFASRVPQNLTYLTTYFG